MEATFKTGVTHAIEANLVKIEGFSQEMYSEVFAMINGGSWNPELLSQIEHHLTEKFHLSTEIITQIHYYFQISVSTAVRETLHLSEEDVITQKEEETTHETTGGSTTTTEHHETHTSGSTTITQTDRQVLFLMVRVHLGLISMEAFYHELQIIGVHWE